MSQLTPNEGIEIKHILEAALLAADEPLNQARLASLFPEDERPSSADIGKALEAIAESCADRGVELREVASGFRLQVKSDLQPWVARLWTEKPQKYSRAMLETLSLIAYRQPITRGEIESVRGVSLSSNIIRSLQEREWIRIVGHRDVPGKPALFGTTKAFLDYFDLKSLDELPTLAEIKDMDTLEPELALDGPDTDAPAEAEASDATDAEGDTGAGPEAGATPADTGEAAAAEVATVESGGKEPSSGAVDEGAARESEGDEALHAADVGMEVEDGPVDDDDLDEAFAELDKAFVAADDVDLMEDDPEPDAGVDPDSPQGDLVAAGAEEAAQAGIDGETVDAGEAAADSDAGDAGHEDTVDADLGTDEAGDEDTGDEDTAPPLPRQ